MTSFEKWKEEFKNRNLYAFNNHPEALLWLKVRAISRRKLMNQFLEANRIALKATTIAQQSAELFYHLVERSDAMPMLDAFLQDKSHEWYQLLGVDDEQLKEELYKVRQYSWGGDQNNSLDKHLISKYVKAINNYDDLVNKRSEMAENAWNYVQASWYNNWTSYLIEALFKKHAGVISAAGEIKNVDFFLKGCPIDLKVTFFPNKYLEERMKAKLGMSEIKWIRLQAKKAGVTADSSLSKNQQIYTLAEKLSDAGHTDILDEWNKLRKEVISEDEKDSENLRAWLYTHQGEMRFGAENRLFLILADAADLTRSWKLKRAFSLIEPRVNAYINSFNAHSLKDTTFTFKGTKYKALSDALFVIKKQ